MKLGQTIISIRKERNMTQEEFARIFHVTRHYLSKILKNLDFTVYF